jgi:hypothetical protein
MPEKKAPKKPTEADNVDPYAGKHPGEEEEPPAPFLKVAPAVEPAPIPAPTPRPSRSAEERKLRPGRK